MEENCTDLKIEKRKIRYASNWTSIMLLLFYASAIGLSFIVRPVTKLFINDGSKDFYNIEIFVLYILQYAVIVPLLIFIFRKTKSGRELPAAKTLFRKSEMPKKWVVKWIIIAISLSYVSSIISSHFFSFIQRLFDVELHPLTLDTDMTFVGITCNVVATMILAPIFEELLFRGTLVRSSVRFGGWSMIVITGAFFGLWHGNYQQAVFATVMGIVLGFIFVKTKSIIPGIITHFIFNTFGMMTSLCVDSIDLDAYAESVEKNDMTYFFSHIGAITGLYILEIVILIITITGLCLYTYEIIKHKDIFILEKNEGKLTSKQSFFAYISAPFTVLMILGFTAITVINALYS